MEQLTDRKHHPCWATFPCSYRKDGLCTFWKQVEAMLDFWAGRDPGNRGCYQSVVDTLREPCFELDEEGRKRGIEDIFGLSR